MKNINMKQSVIQEFFKTLTRKPISLLMTGLFIFTLNITANAQSIENRIAFGFHAGGNKYWGTFTDNQFSFSGDAFIRWNIMDWLSLHASYNGGQIHIKAGDRNVRAFPEYFGGLTDPYYPNTVPANLIQRDAVNVIRHGGWEAMLSGNFFPTQQFVPYLAAGIEFLNFEPRNQNQDHALPGNYAGTYSKDVFGFITGVGFEMYISDKITFNGKGLLHLPGTDYLDDYSTSPTGDETQDVFLTMGLGFSYYIFAPKRAEEVVVVQPEKVLLVETKPKDTDGDGLNDDDEIKIYRTDINNRDTDGDGLTDGEEVLQYKTDPLNRDTDSDGLTDGDEVKRYKTDPLKADTDGDGLKDGQEVNTYKTDPLNPDTDGDGLNDGQEVNTYHTDPLKADTDGDGLKDGAEVNNYQTDPTKADTDNDGLNDGDEINRTHTNPLNPDTDGDSFLDGKDRCPLLAGVGPYGCPAIKKNTVIDFPDILFIVNTDNFNFEQPGTLNNLYKVRELIEQCPDIKVQIKGHASNEGSAERNRELSNMRAAKIKTWLIEQGVSSSKIPKTIGMGTKENAVKEPKNGTPAQIEAARIQNRRISVTVLEVCK